MRVRETMNPMDVTPVPPSPVSSDDLTIIAAQLGRQPRGVIAIAYRCPDGVPGVVTTSPRLPDGTPFPTLYYLTDPRLTAEASRLEVAHVMNWMTDRLNTDLELRADYQRAHDYYLVKRNALADLGTDFSGVGTEAVALAADHANLRGTAIPATWPTCAELGITLSDFDFSNAEAPKTPNTTKGK